MRKMACEDDGCRLESLSDTSSSIGGSSGLNPLAFSYTIPLAQGVTSSKIRKPRTQKKQTFTGGGRNRVENSQNIDRISDFSGRIGGNTGLNPMAFAHTIPFSERIGGSTIRKTQTSKKRIPSRVLEYRIKKSKKFNRKPGRVAWGAGRKGKKIVKRKAVARKSSNKKVVCNKQRDFKKWK
jgi:hypothetical protein